MRFKSKIDTWILVLLIAGPGVGIGTIFLATPPGGPSPFLQALVPLAFFALIYGGLLFPLHYEVAERELVIRFGLVRVRIPLEKIQAVTPTRNPLSSPALSLDRLHIDAGNKLGPNISPVDKAGFLRALAAKAPHLRLEGDRLISAQGRSVT